MAMAAPICRFAEAVVQADWTINGEWRGVAVLRAEPLTPGVVDALETYLPYAPASDGAVSLVGEERRFLSHHQSGE